MMLSQYQAGSQEAVAQAASAEDSNRQTVAVRGINLTPMPLSGMNSFRKHATGCDPSLLQGLQIVDQIDELLRTQGFLLTVGHDRLFLLLTLPDGGLVDQLLLVAVDHS